MRLQQRGLAAVRRFGEFLTRGRAHRQRLDDVDVRISVIGTRGKSTAVTWLYESLYARDVDVYAKITGEEPLSLYDGEAHNIDRDGPVKLYETEREIRRFDPGDAIVVENQGIREYTTRLVNADYVDPTLVVLTNVRRDHLDTLGRDLRSIARSLVRSIPDGVTVVSGERNDELRSWLERELARRDADVVHVFGPDETVDSPADELVDIVDAALAELEVPPLSRGERRDFRDRLSFEWEIHPEGRAFHAAPVNDVESTDFVRRSLMAGEETTIVPIIYFREDRPGRTASFIDYLNRLASAGLVERVHALGAHRGVVTRRLSVPVTWHDEETETPVSVLHAAFDDGEAVLTMGNAVPRIMQDLEALIEIRAAILAQEPVPVSTDDSDLERPA